jgi:membrane protein
MRLVIGSLIYFLKGDGVMFAGAIACFFMLASVPFLVFLVSILGYILGEYKEFHSFFLALLTSIFPSVTHEVTTELGSIIGNKKIGIVTFLLYAFFSYELFLSVETAVRAMFESKSKRPLWLSTLLSLLAVTLLIAFTLASFGAISFLQVLENLQRYLPGLRIGRIAGFLTGYALPAFVVYLTVTMLYIVLPVGVKLRHAALGGLFTMIFIEAAKYPFTFYVAWRVFRLGAVYGSLTALVVFLMWIFYVSSVFLIGARLVYSLGVRSPGAPLRAKPRQLTGR